MREIAPDARIGWPEYIFRNIREMQALEKE
jgi:hypothetical protein